HPARLSGHLRVLDQGRERRDRRRGRPRPRRQRPRRGELHPPAAAAGRRHGLRPRRSAPSRLPGLQGRPSSHPLRQLVQRAQHRPQRHCHQLLLSRADRFRAPAQARRRGPGWSDPFRDPARGARGTIRRLRRDEHAGAARRSLLLEIRDAGGGAGVWTPGLQAQAATSGSFIDLPASVAVLPGGTAEIPVVVRADASAATGDDYGFITLTRGSDVRRVPYYFAVERPGAAIGPVLPLKRFQTGDTRTGTSHISQYRFPASPFGPLPTYTG